jgi:hypothetical protein
MAGDPTPPDAGDRRAQKRQAILETAARLFAEHGYADCDMERLAAELGIAKGTLYLYFPGKQDLMNQGRIRSDLPVERILVTIGGLLYGTMFTNHFVGRAVSLDEQYQSILKILLQGILPC